MRKTKTRTVKGVRIEADDIVVALIDRLMKTEKRLDVLREEMDDQLEMIADQQAKIDQNGNVTLLAMKSDGDSAEQVTVVIEPRKEKTDGKAEQDDLASASRGL